MRGLFVRSLMLASSLLAQTSYAKKTVQFSLSLTWENAAPDGFEKKIIKMNGQFPGPALNVDEGDDVEFLVWNNLPNATSIHFHGIDQIGTPWSDGVSGVSQRPIPPGTTFLYRWNANAYGSYFYHAHLQSQVVDGLIGPIYVRPAPGSDMPFHLISADPAELTALEGAEHSTRPILLNSWYHQTSQERIDIAMATGLDTFCSNSFLINGKGSSICLSPAAINACANPAVAPLLNGLSYTDLGCVPPKVAAAAFPANFSALPSGVFTGCVPSNGGEEVIMVDPANKYARFDLIGVGQLAMTFSIDEHPMTVVAIDGRWVSPTPADAITINSGQRYSVVVRLDRPAGNYTIRSVSGDIAQIIQATGTLAYTGGGGPKHCSASMSKPFVTLGGTNATADTVFLNESLATPFPPVQPSSSINATYVLNIDNAGKAWKWRLGNQSFPMNLDEDNPLLFNPTPQGNLTIANLNGSWIDLVVQPLPATSPAHPIHKHSNKFFVVGHGVGIWNYSSVAQAAAVSPGSFNFIDPPIRDTYPTQAAFGTPTWLVLRYHSENPGAFLLHCHIQGHLYGGMALALLDGVDKFPTVPDEYRFGNGFQNCIAKT